MMKCADCGSDISAPAACPTCGAGLFVSTEKKADGCPPEVAVQEIPDLVTVRAFIDALCRTCPGLGDGEWWDTPVGVPGEGYTVTVLKRGDGDRRVVVTHAEGAAE